MYWRKSYLSKKKNVLEKVMKNDLIENNPKKVNDHALAF